MDESIKDRFIGCLLGGAVGDALGAPVEFMSGPEIAQKFGDAGVRDFLPAYGRRGAITDDTQMTLFSAEGLIRGYTRMQSRGNGPAFVATVGRAYSRWLTTQGLQPATEIIEGHDGWLIGNGALHHARAPGRTCLGALQAKRISTDKAVNDSKGCGGVMRVAPVGMLYRRIGGDQEKALKKAFDLGSDLAALTHGHPTGYLSGGVMAALVLLVLEDVSIGEALNRIRPILVSAPQHQETLGAIDRAEEFALNRAVSPSEAIRTLGQGWVAEEALAIGLYSAMRADNLEEGVIMAVSHGGDSDSTGSIAGNLIGAAAGKRAIPRRWLDALELREVIEEIAVDMAEMTAWDITALDINEPNGADNDRIYAKYPPN